MVANDVEINDVFVADAELAISTTPMLMATIVAEATARSLRAENFEPFMFHILWTQAR